MTTSTSQTMALSLWLMTMSPMIMASFLCTYSVFFACLLGSYGFYVTVTSLNFSECLGTAHKCLEFIQSLPKVVLVWILVELFPDYSAGLWWLYEVYFTLTTIFSFVKACTARIKALGWTGKLLLLLVLLAIIVPVVHAAPTRRSRSRYGHGMPNANAGLLQWHANYAFEHGTVGRDFFKMIGMAIQNIPIPGLHESVSIVRTSFFDGLDYIVMSNPLRVVEFLGFVLPAESQQALLGYFQQTLITWGCIFSPLSKAYYNALSPRHGDAHHRVVGTQWVFRVRTSVLNDLGRGILTELNFHTLREVTIGRIRQPRTKQCPARRRQLPNIIFIINGLSYTSITQARGKLTGDSKVKSNFLSNLKTQLCNRFYRNWNSFITNNPNASILSVSDDYTVHSTGEVTEVTAKFNRGFTQDDFKH